jgi:FkbM family methyltransferase
MRWLLHHGEWIVRHGARASEILVWRAAMPLRHPRRIVKVDGFEVRVHRVGEWIARQLLTTGGYERREIEVLCSHIAPGDTVFDVGANIGLHTLHLSRAVGPNGTVHAFEPDPSNLALLRFNLARNGCDNVVVHPYGLGPADEQRILFECKGNKGYQSLARSEWSTGEIPIEIRRADDVLAGIEASVMKLDVEGAEPFVLAGFAEWPPVIVFEFVPAQLRGMGEDPRAFLDAFLARGYRLELITETGTEEVTPSEMTTRAERTGDDHNLIASRREGLVD